MLTQILESRKFEFFKFWGHPDSDQLPQYQSKFKTVNFRERQSILPQEKVALVEIAHHRTCIQ